MTDALALAVVALFGLLGYRRGGLDMMATFLGILVGLAAALGAQRTLAAVAPLGSTPEASRAAWFLILFATGQLVTVTVVSRLLRRRYSSWAGTRRNHWLGLLPGLLEGTVVAAMLVLVLLLLPQKLATADELHEGAVTGPLLKLGGVMQAAIHEEFGSGVRELLGMGPPIGVPDRRYPLPATSHGEREPGAEQELFDLLNGARREAGLPLLERDSALDEVAVGHCGDMWRRGYFGHADPEGRDVQFRVEERGLGYTLVGENLALAPTAGVAHRGLLDSPGHRSNMLSSKFRRAGVGAVRGPTGVTFTQVFRD